MDNLQLSFINDEVSQTIEGAIAFALENKLNFIELRSIKGINILNLPEATVCEISKELQNVDLKISALTSPLFKWYSAKHSQPIINTELDTFGFSPELSIDDKYMYIDRAIKYCKILKTENLRIFSLLRTPDLYAPSSFIHEEKELYDYLNTLAKLNSIEIIIEPEISCNFYSIKQVASIKEFNILLDVGNLYQVGEFVEASDIDKIAEKIAYIHVKDYDIKTKRFVPVGTGNIPFQQILQHVATSLSRKVFVSLETHSKTNKLNESQSSLNAIKNYLNLTHI